MDGWTKIPFAKSYLPRSKVVALNSLLLDLYIKCCFSNLVPTKQVGPSWCADYKCIPSKVFLKILDVYSPKYPGTEPWSHIRYRNGFFFLNFLSSFIGIYLLRSTPRSCYRNQFKMLIKGTTCDTLRPPAHFPLFCDHKGSVKGYQSGEARDPREWRKWRFSLFYKCFSLL